MGSPRTWDVRGVKCPKILETCPGLSFLQNPKKEKENLTAMFSFGLKNSVIPRNRGRKIPRDLPKIPEIPRDLPKGAREGKG